MKLRRMVVWIPVLLAGCSFNGDGTPQVLGPAAFYDDRSPVDPEQRREAVDSGGAIVHNPAILDEPKAPGPPQVTRISPSVVAAAETTMAEPANAVLTAPSTTLPSGTTAQYLTAGAVVVKVGGVPIYADKVIRSLTPMLAQDAKDLDTRAFQLKAQKEITDQVGKMVKDELYYATATQNLTAQEIQLAWGATYEWKKKQITAAGGSEEQARARARAEGVDFDEKVNDEYRVNVWRVYLQKKVWPLVQVTANDIRAYYTQHPDEFKEHEQVQCRVIKIAVAPGGTRDDALNKVKAIREKLATASADEFAKEAGEVNDDRGLKASGGRMSNDGWLRKGSFAVAMKDVEEAIWKLQVGQVSEVIEATNGYYIARLDDRKVGKVQSFDDVEVQAKIKEKLRQPQIEARSRQLEQRLLREAIIEPPQPTLVPVLEMALQKYPEWRGK